VGGLTGLKGHGEVAEAFARLDTGGRAAALILNGNRPFAFGPPAPQGHAAGRILDRALAALREEGLRALYRRAQALLARKLQERSFPREASGRFAWTLLRCLGITPPPSYWVDRANRQPAKTVFFVDLPRSELVQAFMAADLFVFASHIEYSPLVLFESAAAGTPFLSVPVGNAEEIARWTGGGLICPARIDARGYTRVDPRVLAVEMRRAMDNPQLLADMGAAARASWSRHFTWDTIARYYEAVLRGAPVAVGATLPG